MNTRNRVFVHLMLICAKAKRVLQACLHTYERAREPEKLA